MATSYPFHNLLSPIISTLFSGSAMVIKCSEATAWSTTHFTRMVHTALSSCGHSPDLVQSILCWPETANHLTSHPGISHITFIGSHPVALKVAASAAKALTPCVMELGGKDPSIVLDSADSELETVASILMRGVFQSAGQNCIGIERIIATPKVYTRLVSMLAERVSKLRVGWAGPGAERTDDDCTSGPDVGSLISPVNIPKLEGLISSAVADGATLHHGGQAHNHPLYPSGHYFSPTLLSSITPAMTIAQTELFAPIALVLPASSVTDAIALANSTPYALGASVFGSPSSPEIEQVVNGVKAGLIAVNDFGSTYAVQLPFGGVKGSGYGRFAGEEGLRGLCNLKAVTRDGGVLGRVFGVRTRIPGRLDYPIRDLSKGWEFVAGVVGVGYASGRQWVGSLVKLVRNA